MDAIKKQRKALRSAFTKIYNIFEAKCEGDFSREERLVAFQLLETKAAELDAVYATYNKALFETCDNGKKFQRIWIRTIYTR